MTQDDAIVIRMTGCPNGCARPYIAEIGFDPQFGARPVKRAIQREVLNALSKSIISGEVHADSVILIDSFEGNIVFRNVEEEAKI